MQLRGEIRPFLLGVRGGVAALTRTHIPTQLKRGVCICLAYKERIGEERLINQKVKGGRGRSRPLFRWLDVVSGARKLRPMQLRGAKVSFLNRERRIDFENDMNVKSVTGNVFEV